MLKFILGIIIGAVIVWFLFKKSAAGKAVNPEQIEEKQKNLEKIMDMAHARGKVANDEVEKALGISDRTATRYLEELESQGKIQQVGRTGKSVTYRPR
ncbi:MAG: hypothetical protein A2751_02630 [Candidatus Doudnabacteria bacterium RIFCSPHIGHO2_01_FULL_46_14]|uniref:Uncharacterized protein n=1 Tax=Candidatus Doudnabacteria bacterium RIFCSPHIGHO2_01_FULL_46_14 TaxID=1817824 RepID=A0A1F5NJN7_9BACT|nr:MAG: hypothetical protein A2751_02630 [Candidatus Doudnabacteria bacterium RIFCSPHIGHO2_01_FULL_46_14]